MNFKIHCSTPESGACIEVWTRKTRILINICQPDVDRAGREIELRSYVGQAPRTLVSKGVLPDIQGLYTDAGGLLNGILISDLQQDYAALAPFIHEDIPFFLGEASYRRLNGGALPAGMKEVFKKRSFLERYSPFVIGDLKISPFRMDHSDAETYAFLVEGERAAVFLSGDIRTLDRRREAYQRYLRYAPKNVDYLLLQIHSDAAALKEFVLAINPKNIVAIPTWKGAEYKRLFSSPVKEVLDGEVVSC